jgi:predicted ester cyclase
MTEQTKAMLRRLYAEAIDGDNLELIDELCAPGMIVHDPFMGRLEGIASFKQLIQGFKTGFPGFRTELHALIVDGDQAAIHHTHFAQNTGEFLGMPPTGRSVVVEGVELIRMRDGKIVEFWRHDDDAGLLRQLGVLQLGEAPSPV